MPPIIAMALSSCFLLAKVYLDTTPTPPDSVFLLFLFQPDALPFGCLTVIYQ